MNEDQGVKERWREWARGQGIPGERLEPAVEAAMRVAGSGANVEAAAAAARLAGGCGRDGDLDLLRRGLARAGVVLEELGGLRAAGPLTAEALGALSGVFEARQRALAEALEAVFEPAPAPPPAAAAPPRRPAAPTLREFFTEHSILLLSYVGAFLLVVAAVLYEVYAIGELSGALRFAGVLALDLVFAAAGWACLRSPRMRLVGHTYVAVFALLAPLVCVAAYVFLGLRQEGISLQMALLLTGAALTVLYAVLCLRLRSQAYGFLALAALAVAWLGGIETAGSGAWNGPVAAVLLPAYALTGFGARGVPGLGERFAAWAALFVHGAVLLALAVTLDSTGSVVSPAASATLAVVGAGYLLARLLNGMPAAAHLGLAALGLAWAVAAHALGLGGWITVAVVPLVAAYSLLGWSGTFVAPAARDLVPRAALLVSALTAALWAGDLSAGHGTAWWLPAALALLAGAYALHRVLTGQARALLVTAAAASLAVLAGNAALDGGFDQASAALLVLAATWAVAAEGARDTVLRLGLRTGMAVQALVPVLFVALPPRTAAPVLLASAALLAVGAWRTRTPAWLLLAAGTFTIDWYWLGRALLPPTTPGPTALALLYSPLPVVLAATGLVLRAALGRGWALPLYVVALAPAAVVPALALNGNDLSLAGRALLAYAALTYAVAAVEGWAPAVVAAGLAAAGGLLLALAGAGAAPGTGLLALTGLAAAVYAGQLPWRSAGRRDWQAAHRLLGLAGGGAVALAGFTLPDAARQGATDALLAGAAVLAFAGLLAADARLGGPAALDHAAVVAGSVAGYFGASYLGATNPQWYVAAPGLALLSVGLALPHDRRLAAGQRLAPAVTAAGAALLLGTTAAQAFADPGWAYTAWLVAESVAAVLVGIGMRSRTLVVAGGAAAGASGLRALFVLVQHGLLFAAFGAAALFLLGLGAALAALRDRVRGPLGAAWREWN